MDDEAAMMDQANAKHQEIVNDFQFVMAALGSSDFNAKALLARSGEKFNERSAGIVSSE